MNLALLGGGRMGEALAVGLLEAGWTAETIAIAEIDADRRRLLEEHLPGVRVVPSPAWAAPDAAVVVVAVKPDDVGAALEACAPVLADGALVLSIAAGVTIETLEAGAPGHPVVRAMPNTGALVGRGAAAISAGTLATEADLELAERVLGAVGIVVRVPEKQLDAVTGLSGSGPAYVFLVAEAMIEAGVLVGLPRDTAGRARAPDPAGRGHVARRRHREPRVVARRGDLSGRHHRGRTPGAGSARDARRVARCHRSRHAAIERLGPARMTPLT